MNILLINTNNNAGGATKACYRLHQAYQKAGMHSKVLINDTPPSDIHDIYNFYEWYQTDLQKRSLIKRVKDKVRDTFSLNGSFTQYLKETCYQQELLDQRPQSLEVFTFHNSMFDITEHPLYAWADIIHLHWVANHFFDFRMFEKIGKPVVWTLHDTNPFTGGCHYTEGCERFKVDCAPCPQLKGTKDESYAGKMMEANYKSIQGFNPDKLKIVSPSVWLMNLSSSSKVLGKFKHDCIPYGIDDKVFTLRDRETIRQRLNIPDHKFVILFAAFLMANKRKGFGYLLNSLAKLNAQSDILLLSVGAGNSEIEGLEIEHRHLGMIREEEILSEIYNSADVFIIPSLEDNLPNTVLESLMCGTPVIGFPIGGIPDMIKDGFNGLLTPDISIEALTLCINRLKENGLQWNRNEISGKAKGLYSAQKQVDAYINLYAQLISNAN